VRRNIPRRAAFRPRNFQEKRRMDELTSQARRMMEASLDWWRLGWQVTETMIASQAVIGRRMMMVGAGLNRTGRMPYAEMSRFVPEKAAAFSEAGAGAVRVLAAGGAGNPFAVAASVASESLTMFDLFERSIAASAAWWAPLHAGATSNARRLAHRRKG
jgi:hypothetical protein